MAFIASKPKGACPRVEVNKMPCIPSARDITILYPVGTATIVTIDIHTDLSFVTKKDTSEQGYLAVRTK